MNLSNLIKNPRGTIARWQDTFELGRRLKKLENTHFASGLKDSGWILFGLARAMKPDVCVEIGSARGWSACLVGRALAENGKGKLYAIDPHQPTDWNDSKSVDTIEVMRQNLAMVGVEDYVEIVRKTSQEAAKGWDKKIDLIFIDGDHSYEGVKSDWGLFYPHVKESGVILFHDTAWEIDPRSRAELNRTDMGVPRFVEELRQSGYPVITSMNNRGVSLVQPVVGSLPLKNESET